MSEYVSLRDVKSAIINWDWRYGIAKGVRQQFAENISKLDKIVISEESDDEASYLAGVKAGEANVKRALKEIVSSFKDEININLEDGEYSQLKALFEEISSI